MVRVRKTPTPTEPNSRQSTKRQRRSRVKSVFMAPTSATPYFPAARYAPPTQISLSPSPGPGIQLADIMTTTAAPPTPLDWGKSCEDTVRSLQPFSRINIRKSTWEYFAVSQLVNSAPGLMVSSIERVVNPTLWKKFVTARKELLISKSSDLNILSNLEMTAAELKQRTHIVLNSNPEAKGIPQYSDNVALLFHGTRGNIDTVLAQGLDERLGNGGLFGRGIYLADDPAKSAGYDTHRILIVFAVLLGDCKTVTGGGSTREPEKNEHEKRNSSDLFFDSTVGRSGANEYVIFNRQHCVPLYLVHYNLNHQPSSSESSEIAEMYRDARSRLPPFAWKPFHDGKSSPLLNPGHATRWPMFAQTIFKLMGASTSTPAETTVRAPLSSINNCKTQSIWSTAAATETTTTPSQFQTSGKQTKSIESHLATLRGMGFTDEKSNTLKLKEFDYDLERTVDYLLSEPTSSWSCRGPVPGMDNQAPLLKTQLASPRARGFADGTCNTVKLEELGYNSERTEDALLDSVPVSVAASVSSSSGTTGVPGAETSSHKDTIECSICYNPTTQWANLDCQHKLCIKCRAKLLFCGRSMSKKIYSYRKCPFCKRVSGTELGTCPDGTMTTEILKLPLPGYAKYDTISVTYNVSKGKHSVHWVTYFPDSNEGIRAVELLRTAWDRRLVLSVGTNMTTGRDDALVWNIHHKTAMTGGVEACGYPDPTYLDRLFDELKQYGIE